MAVDGVTTLLAIRNLCKSQSDNVGQSYLLDADWNAIIQGAYQELYGKIVEAFGNDYFVQSPSAGYTFTTDGINDHFALPDGVATPASPAFFKLLGVDVRLTSSNQYVALKPFSFSNRNQWGLFNSGIPMAGQTIRVLYVPRLTLPTQDADTVDGVNGWEDYIVAKSCMIALAKEESDVSVFMARLSATEKRLASEIENRDAGSPATIVDVSRTRSLGMGYRLNGSNLWLQGGTTPGWAPQGDWDGPGLGWY